jgi:hypothetical protein
MNNETKERVLKLALAAWSSLVPALILVAAVLWYFRPARP